VESVGEMFSLGAVQILGDSLFLIGTFIMLLFVDVNLTFYSALMLPILAVGMYYFRRFTKQSYVKVRQSLSTLNGFLQEYLSGMTTVQLANQLPKVHKEFSEHNNEFLAANQQAIAVDAAIYSFIDALSYVAAAFVLWGGFQLKLDNALSLGILVAFLEALGRFFQPLRELSNRYAIFQSALVSLERIYELFSWPEEREGNGAGMPLFKQYIQFRNVSFCYQGREPALKNINFTLNIGERIALVGPTGAGKSTVIKLLNRFYSVSDGEILIDGQNIEDLPLGITRRLISVVPQEGFLFHGYLHENLRFGRLEASDDDLWRALYLAQMADVIKKRGGLSCLVQPRGQNFSLGERQLLAIARALVANPPILILDEAFASVDAITEKRLQAAIKELLRQRTALMIAHRLSTILDADRILVFNHGAIVEEGSHQILMKNNGLYAGLIRAHEIRKVDSNIVLPA
jgi:ATP-binding cassette subfamily B protein